MPHPSCHSARRRIEKSKGPRFECMWCTVSSLAPPFVLLLQTPQDLHNLRPPMLLVDHAIHRQILSIDVLERRTRTRRVDQTKRGTREVSFRTRKGKKREERPAFWRGGGTRSVENDAWCKRNGRSGGCVSILWSWNAFGPPQSITTNTSAVERT